MTFSFFFFFCIIYKDGSFERHETYKNKRLENNFMPITISINDMDKLKKELTKKRTFTKKHLV